MSRSQQALDVVADELCVTPADLRPDAKLEDFRMDSLDMLSILFNLEKKIGIKLPSTPPSRGTTVQDLLNIVEQAPPA